MVQAIHQKYNHTIVPTKLTTKVTAENILEIGYIERKIRLERELGHVVGKKGDEINYQLFWVHEELVYV